MPLHNSSLMLKRPEENRKHYSVELNYSQILTEQSFLAVIIGDRGNLSPFFKFLRAGFTRLVYFSITFSMGMEASSYKL